MPSESVARTSYIRYACGGRSVARRPSSLQLRPLGSTLVLATLWQRCDTFTLGAIFGLAPVAGSTPGHRPPGVACSGATVSLRAADDLRRQRGRIQRAILDACCPLVVAGGAIVLVLAAVGLRMTTRSSRFFIALLFSVGLVLWIQGNLLVADYGVLDGRDIDWTNESWRNPHEMALWILAPLLSIAAARHVAPIAPFASAALLTLQTVVLLASALDNDARAHATWQRSIGLDVRPFAHQKRDSPRAGRFSIGRLRRHSSGRSRATRHVVSAARSFSPIMQARFRRRLPAFRQCSRGRLLIGMSSPSRVTFGTASKTARSSNRFAPRDPCRQHHDVAVRQFVGDLRLPDSAPLRELWRVHPVCRLGACRSVVVPACAPRPARANLQRSEMVSPASIRTTRHERSPVSRGKRGRCSRQIRTAVDPGGGRPAVQVHSRRRSPPAGRAQRKL